ncbi:MAG: hypothetical protein U1E27_05455, partial [Kiritimatiellia bacterium]|nr:hypothetical protein [Kiritimatiellia bacterium]
AALNTKLDILTAEGLTQQIVFLTGLPTNGMVQAFVDRDYEPWFYGIDEPNDTNKIVQHILRSKRIHEQSYNGITGKVMTAITKDWSLKLDDPNDPIYSLPGVPTGAYEPLDQENLHCYSTASVGYMSELISGAKTNGKPALYYWQSLQERPALNRLYTGYWLWNTGLDGVAPYVYQHISNNPYDDFDQWSTSPNGYRDHLTTYPSQEGPVPTMQWKSYLEGVNDVRYLQTWKKYFEAILTSHPTQAAQSKAVVDGILENFKDFGNFDAVSPDHFAQYRADLLNEMDAVYALWRQSVTQLTWTNPDGGIWQMASNWDPALSPIPGDTLHFTNSFGSPFAVSLRENATVHRIDARRGSFVWALDLAGHELKATVDTGSSLEEGLLLAAVGQVDQTLYLTSSSPGGVLEINRFRIGTSGSSSELFMGGSNLTIRLTGTTGDASLISGGTGTVTCADGMKMESLRPLLLGTGGTTTHPSALWRVTDPGTVVSNASSLYIGKAGTNLPTLIISNRAAFYSFSTRMVGQGGDAAGSWNTNANGRIVITGADSVFHGLGGSLTYLGQRAGNSARTAGGFIEILEGGRFESHHRLVLGEGNTNNWTSGNGAMVQNRHAYGDILVRDPDSTLRMNTDHEIYVGQAGNGRIRVQNGGALVSGHDIWLGRGNIGSVVNAQSLGELEISGTGSRVEANRLFIGWTGIGDAAVETGGRLSVTNGATPTIRIESGSRLTLRDNGWAESGSLTNAGGEIRIELGSRPKTDAYLKLTGLLALNAGSELSLSVLSGATLSPDDTVQLIANGFRSGTFAGLVDGERISADGYDFTIHYGVNAIYLTVLPPPPQISAQPQINGPVEVGANVALSVTASGQGLNYQWYRKQGDAIVAIGGATHT